MAYQPPWVISLQSYPCRRIVVVLLNPQLGVSGSLYLYQGYKFNSERNSATRVRTYRTLRSYNLIWAVCHLFPQQRWRTHTNIQSRETIGQENHVTSVKLRPRKFHPAFLKPIPRHVFSIDTSSSNTLFFPISIAALTHSLQCDTLLIQS